MLLFLLFEILLISSSNTTFTMIIKSREDFGKYILQTLGEPVIQVNISAEQLDNVIDDALSMFHQFHYEGSIRCILKQIITPSILRLAETLDHNDCKGTVKGITSNATTELVTYNIEGRNKSGNGVLYCQNTKGTFICGETVEINGKKVKLSNNPNNFWEEGIIDSHKIKVPDWIIGVQRILPYGQQSSANNLFDLQYQIRLNDFLAYDTFHTGDIIYYESAMQHIDMINYELNAKPGFEFNQYGGYLYPLVNWGFDFVCGQYMIIECIRLIDPTQSPRMFNDVWLKRYSVALAKKQWGMNLSKFQNMQLPGGVTFNGSELMQQAQTELDKLEEQLLTLVPTQAFRVG